MKNFFFPIVLFSLLLFSCKSNDHYDILILNAEIYDGSGGASYQGDLGIVGDKIIHIGDLKKSTAERIIDAQGLALAPGFIDMHTHLEPLMELPMAESLVRQGVTTSLGGPDGSSPWPLADYMDSLGHLGVGLNVAYLIGHNTVRKNIMGMEDRVPTADELTAMKEQVEQGMKDGAFGISTGLKYLPGTFSKTDEVIELSKIASMHGGIYTSHLREEGLGLLNSVKEAIEISREAKIPVVLTHHKAIGIKMWGASKYTLAMVDSARELGLDIMIDQYPYTASHTGISVLIPSWALEGGPVDEFTRRVQDPLLRDSIKQGIIFNILNDRGGSDLRRVQFSRVSWKKELEGKTLHDWAIMEGMEPTVENGAELVITAQMNGGLNAIYHAIDPEDVKNIMQHPMTMIGSDGRLSNPGNGHPHPRAYGTFPRVLGYYVRENQLMSLETAIRKMTGLSADRLGLTDRGYIKEGNYADLVLFNPATVLDKSTFENPHQYPEGIPYVIVNGTFAVDDSQWTNAAKGKVLRKNAAISH
ncbi:MAG: D-aminoacylase [Cyclobacteriaceae bacterium]|nr:D-aminoacylase [Cyclobacteriaceae bacterium]